MSYQTAIEPQCETCAGAVSLVIRPSEKDLGEFTVRRVLPAVQRRMVGPFIFFDHMGPAEFITGQGIDVRPHPHIGLATVTYLFEGEIDHKDSLGNDMTIRPGDVNLMTAGSGIVHSERTGEQERADRPGEQARALLASRPEIDIVVFGHTHRPELVEVEPGRHYLNAGDWIHHRSYALLTADSIALSHWHPD